MRLQVRGNYLFGSDGGSGKQGDGVFKPFFWLGDTAWLLFEKAESDEIKFYLDDRAEKGFNVVQATILHTVAGVESGRTSRGEYFDKIFAAAEYAREKGIYFALLPCWGDFVKRKILRADNYARYARFLGEKFRSLDNIIWMLGGDIRGSDAPGLFSGFAEILKEYNPERLITFHPFGRTGSYLWFHDCDWLDFNAFQSGHRRYGQTFPGANDCGAAGERDYEEDNYKYVGEALARRPLKPCLDAEPSYEGIVQGLHDFSQPRWQARDVRRYAYWSVFAGACGFTYGHNAVMQLHREGDADANYGVREDWRDALAADGARQMTHLKELMLSVDFPSGRRRDDLVLSGGEKYGHVACFAGEDFALAYVYDGSALRLSPPFDGECAAYEFNPADGERHFVGNFGCRRELCFPYNGNSDRVVILRKI